MFLPFLIENRIEFLKKQHEAGISTSHDPYAIHKSAPKIIDHFALHADPTPHKEYTQWVVGQYKKQNIRQEDADRIKSALEKFHTAKPRLTNKDINNYTDVSDVEQAVSKPGVVDDEDHADAGLHVMYKDDKYQINHLQTQQASMKIYGGGASGGRKLGTNWCTAARSENNMFSHYNSQGPLYTIHVEDDRNSPYQYHKSSQQFMDRFDRPVDVYSFSKQHPVASEKLEHASPQFLSTPEKITKYIDEVAVNRPHELDAVYTMLGNSPHFNSSHVDQIIDHTLAKDATKHRGQLIGLMDTSPHVNKQHINKIMNHVERFSQKANAVPLPLAALVAHIPTKYIDEDLAHRVLSLPSDTRSHVLHTWTSGPSTNGLRNSHIANVLPKEFVSDAIERSLGNNDRLVSTNTLEYIARHTPHAEHLDILSAHPNSQVSLNTTYNLNSSVKHLINAASKDDFKMYTRLYRHPNYNHSVMDHLVPKKFDDLRFADSLTLVTHKGERPFTQQQLGRLLSSNAQPSVAARYIEHVRAPENIAKAKEEATRVIKYGSEYYREHEPSYQLVKTAYHNKPGTPNAMPQELRQHIFDVSAEHGTGNAKIEGIKYTTNSRVLGEILNDKRPDDSLGIISLRRKLAADNPHIDPIHIKNKMIEDPVNFVESLGNSLAKDDNHPLTRVREAGLADQKLYRVLVDAHRSIPDDIVNHFKRESHKQAIQKLFPGSPKL